MSTRAPLPQQPHRRWLGGWRRGADAAPAATGWAAARRAERIARLLAARWSYGLHGHPPATTTLRLAENGRIEGYDHPNECYWRYLDDTLIFYHADGMETVRFTEAADSVFGLLQFSGGFLLDPAAGLRLTLVQTAAGPAPAAAALLDHDLSEARLLVAVSFLFRPRSLAFLQQVAAAYRDYPVRAVDLVVLTDTAAADERALIADALLPYFHTLAPDRPRVLEILTADHLEDGWQLTWRHKPLIAQRFLADAGRYTHFIYSEDDLPLTSGNFRYFVNFRDSLRPWGLLPSFCVTECSDRGVTYAKEQFEVNHIHKKRICAVGDYWLFNQTNPFNGLYILDQPLALEYVATDSFDFQRSRRRSDWWVAERAAMGLCFEAVPAGFASRYVTPVLRRSARVPHFALVAHLPNKYANDPASRLSKIPLRDAFAWTDPMPDG